jgi:hypothetical protein
MFFSLVVARVRDHYGLYTFSRGCLKFLASTGTMHRYSYSTGRTGACTKNETDNENPRKMAITLFFHLRVRSTSTVPVRTGIIRAKQVTVTLQKKLFVALVT